MWYELLSRGRHNFYEYSWLRDLVESEISFKEVMGALLERKREERMIYIFDKDQVDADHGAGERRTDSLYGTTGRHIACPDCSPCGHDDGASDFEGGQVEVFDVVPFHIVID